MAKKKVERKMLPSGLRRYFAALGSKGGKIAAQNMSKEALAARAKKAAEARIAKYGQKTHDSAK